jgi:hypothetical protein
MRRVAALVTIVLALPAAARAAAFDVNDASWEGCADLLDLARRELGEARVVVTGALDWEAIGASDGLLVLHPTHDIELDEATAFMKAGGRLAVVDDYGRGDRLLAHFKIRRRSLPASPLRYLRGRPALAIAQPVLERATAGEFGLHPTVADVRQVVLNHASGLEHPDLTPVLEVRAADGAAVAAAVAGQVAQGRLFAMGDPSAFINQMLRYQGNRRFAAGLVRYLADGEPTSPRQGRLFIVANDFGERGSFGGVTPLRKALDRKLAAAAEALEALRTEGFPWWLHVVVAALAALSLALFAARGLVRLYEVRLPRFARPPPLAAQGGVAGRVAVLGATSSAALAILELRSALAEALAQRLGASPLRPLEELVTQARRAGELPAALEERLGGLGDLLRRAEQAVLAQQPLRVSRADFAALAKIARELEDALAAERVVPRGP